MKKQLIAICIIVILLMVGLSGCFEETKETPTVQPKTIYVDDSGGKDYTSIQSAINVTNPGDTVYVYNGTYVEKIVINKTITLVGEDKNNTVILGGGHISADHVKISGFTIKNNPYNAYGIETYSNYSSITNNIIINNKGGGILFDRYSNNNTISGNTINNNGWYGLNLWVSDNNAIYANTISNCYTGINLFYSNNNIFYHNNLINNNINVMTEIIVLADEEASGSYYPINNVQNQQYTGNNTWYDTTLNEGNYWDDYSGLDNDGDAIGDTPYGIIGEVNQDLYPLMNPLITSANGIENFVGQKVIVIGTLECNPDLPARFGKYVPGLIFNDGTEIGFGGEVPYCEEYQDKEIKLICEVHQCVMPESCAGILLSVIDIKLIE